MRLDKFLSSQTAYSRSDIKRLIKSGAVAVDNVTAKTADQKIDENKSVITLNGEVVGFKSHVYLMLNKPEGVVSATEDRSLPTVVDLIGEDFSHRELFPAGRLDRDTTGFVLLTDDGDFAHKILSPKNHVPKTYEAVLNIPAPENAEEVFEKGVVLSDGTPCLSARLSFKSDRLHPTIVIREGMYHQIKRMFASLGCHVVSLKRVKMGDLYLDENLKPGEYRELTAVEISQIENAKM